nr:ELMO domain-containing protein A-like isoform X1 [Ipomoea batatas]
MDEKGGGSFVAVRRISQGLDRSNTCHSDSAEVVAGSAAWLGRGLSCICAQARESDARPSFNLTPAQEECLQRLQSRMDISYDRTIPEHQSALRALWNAAFPEEELRDLISEQWKEMGWQGKDPSTDFRGGGFISLENLLYFAKNFPNSFQDLLQKREGDRSMWEYPFAVAGVNITFMLIQMLDLEAVKPRNLVGATFLKFLAVSHEGYAEAARKGTSTRRRNTAGRYALLQPTHSIVLYSADILKVKWVTQHGWKIRRFPHVRTAFSADSFVLLTV